MQDKLIDLITCPMCKSDSFSIMIFTEDGDYIDSNASGCEESSINKNYKKEKQNHNIKNGILLCNSCGRWYPIINGIYILLPDIYRDENNDMDFLIKYKTYLTDITINNGKTFNIKVPREYEVKKIYGGFK